MTSLNWMFVYIVDLMGERHIPGFHCPSNRWKESFGIDKSDSAKDKNKASLIQA